jgi:hypothetical protein
MCPALRPRRDLSARPLPRFGVAFRLFNGVGLRENRNFGAQSHGPFTRCLRFAGWVAPPRKIRFRMAGQPCPGGSGYPLGPTERFQVIPFPFPRLCLAHSKLTLAAGFYFRGRYRISSQGCCRYP